MNRTAIAILGGLAGMAAALLLVPGSRKRIAHEVGARLRSTPLVESGQEVARQVAQRAQGLAADVAEIAQDVAGKATQAVGKARGAAMARSQNPAEAAEMAADAAQKALDAVDELVRRTQDVLHAARKRLD